MRRRAHPRPVQDDTGRQLVTRQVAAYLAQRHVDQVRKAVPAVACDVATRAQLVDLDDVEQTLAGRQHRHRMRPLPVD